MIALAVQSTPVADETVTVETPVTVTTATKLDIPDEIAPALFPYVSCRIASRGEELRQNGVVVKPVVAKGADCSAARKRAAKDANGVLKQNSGQSASARGKIIADALAAIDAFPPTAQADAKAQ
ncbi:MAG: hypothetical protein KF783_03145 [Sphingomonas sp.]|nr:hypothetical protein [Sphingomonas sp.]